MAPVKQLALPDLLEKLADDAYPVERAPEEMMNVRLRPGDVVAQRGTRMAQGTANPLEQIAGMLD